MQLNCNIQQYIQHLDSTLIKGSLSNEIEFIHWMEYSPDMFSNLQCIFSSRRAEWRHGGEIEFVTNSSFLIPLSLQPDGVNLWNFKLYYLIQQNS